MTNGSVNQPVPPHLWPTGLAESPAGLKYLTSPAILRWVGQADPFHPALPPLILVPFPPLQTHWKAHERDNFRLQTKISLLGSD